MYYFSDHATGPERYIAATIWDPEGTQTTSQRQAIGPASREAPDPTDPGTTARRANCRIRRFAGPSILMKLLLRNPTSGSSGLTLLSKLNASQRNCIANQFMTGKSLFGLKSKLKDPGPPKGPIQLGR